ncbi:hypothetical protein DVH24_020622 [Malus domestica]|uniref:Interferon-related developmental regulator N-terminal domain-containing protein n=1 Tax=Malus domestica TaxID=3750 RepID=A0A498J752_MALDO|nr:hypothetical protein DVH24_020622 [Malus domestica]
MQFITFLLVSIIATSFVFADFNVCLSSYYMWVFNCLLKKEDIRIMEFSVLRLLWILAFAGSSQRKNAAMMDSDDDNSSVSSTSTMRSDHISVSVNEDMQVDKDSLLDQAVDALYEKRGSTREKALSAIIDAFNSNMQHLFVEKKFATLLHQCLNCIKKGSSKEICLASHVIGLLALTVGCGDNAHEILEESLPVISQAFKSGSEVSKTSALLECLAIITFVGGSDPDQTEKSMQIMWQVVHPKQSSNVMAVKLSAAAITTMVSAWSFLLTTVDGWNLNFKDWQESITYLSSLLDKDDRSMRIAAGEALALIFEIGSLEKFSAGANTSSNASTEEGNKPREYVHIQGLKSKIINQARNLSAEAGGKSSAKKDLSNQRNTFRDILDYLEENELLQDVLGFNPKKKNPSDSEHRLSGGEKRMFRSPNSVQSKARTQLLNKQRMLSEGKNIGRFAANMGDDA